MNDVAVLERPWLRFVGITYQVNRLLLVRFDETPFHAARKSGAAAAAQTGRFHFVHDVSARHFDGFAQIVVTAVV